MTIRSSAPGTRALQSLRARASSRCARAPDQRASTIRIRAAGSITAASRPAQARSRIVKASSTCTWGSQRETAFATTCRSCGAARRSPTTSITAQNDMGPGNAQFIYALYNTRAAAPTCGPETIAPGLTVNGCTSSGQITSLLNPNLLYAKRFIGSGYPAAATRVRRNPSPAAQPTWGMAITLRTTCRSERRLPRA